MKLEDVKNISELEEFIAQSIAHFESVYKKNA